MFSVLIQNSETHDFLASGNEWKKLQTDAKAFGSGTDAIDHCLAHNIEGYQLVIHVHKERQSVKIPKAGEPADCDNLVKTIKAVMESRRPVLDIPTPPLPRYYVLCTGLRGAVEDLKQLPSLLRLTWNSPKLSGHQRGRLR